MGSLESTALSQDEPHYLNARMTWMFDQVGYDVWARYVRGLDVRCKQDGEERMTDEEEDMTADRFGLLRIYDESDADSDPEHTARPMCNCRCGCRKKPGRRIWCRWCYRRKIGPCCLSSTHSDSCHVCMDEWYGQYDPNTRGSQDEAPTTAAAENDNVVIDIAALFDEDGPGTAGAELEPSNP